MASMHGQCRCGNSDTNNVWVLTNENEDETFGICCKKRSCNSEYLISRFIDDRQLDGDASITFNDIPLYYKGQTILQDDTNYQTALDRTRITHDNLTSLRRGDHIMFKRWQGIWHHAVVVKERNNSEGIDVIHWQGTGGKKSDLIIIRQTLPDGEFSKCWRINYSTEQEEQNSPDLVIARAMLRLSRADEERYSILNENCEHLATYCKLGSSLSLQVSYFWSQLKNVPLDLLKRSGRMISHVVKALLSKCGVAFTSEVLENIVQSLTGNPGYLELLGLSTVIITELISLKKHYNYLKAERMKPENPITEETFKEELQKKVVECVVTILLYGGVGASLFWAGCPLLLEVILCTALQLLCKALLPQLLSNFIDWLFGEDSALVTYLSHLSAMLSHMSIDLSNLVMLRPAVMA